MLSPKLLKRQNYERPVPVRRRMKNSRNTFLEIAPRCFRVFYARGVSGCRHRVIKRNMEMKITIFCCRPWSNVRCSASSSKLSAKYHQRFYSGRKLLSNDASLRTIKWIVNLLRRERKREYITEKVSLKPEICEIRNKTVGTRKSSSYLCTSPHRLCASMIVFHPRSTFPRYLS